MNKHAKNTATGGSARSATLTPSSGNGSLEHNGLHKEQAPTRTMAKAWPEPWLRHDVSWGDPYSMMRQLADEMDAMLDGFGLDHGPQARRRGFEPATPLAAATWLPPVEVEERDGKLLVRADLPGLKKEDVHLRLDDDVLTISGERRQEHEENRAGLYHSERSYGRFQRIIPLRGPVDADQVQATFRDGVLEVTMPAPVADTPRARQISIQG